jgi:hypothetical protein
MATLPVPAGPPNCYGPNVKENARTPGSFVTSVSTWCRRGAPATKRIMPDRSKCATPSAPTSAPADRFAAALLMALSLREQFSQDRLSSFAKGLRVNVPALCKRLKADKRDEPAS